VSVIYVSISGTGIWSERNPCVKQAVADFSHIHAVEKSFNYGWTQMNPARLTPQPQILDCGGKRSATPLWEATGRAESGVAAALCHRSPNLCHPCAKLQDCITDRKKISAMQTNSPINEAFRIR
jgi:hypothetical protein